MAGTPAAQDPAAGYPFVGEPYQWPGSPGFRAPDVVEGDVLLKKGLFSPLLFSGLTPGERG